MRLVLDGSHHGAYEQRVQEVAGRESASDLASALYFVATFTRGKMPTTFLWSYKSRTAPSVGTLNY